MAEGTTHVSQQHEVQVYGGAGPEGGAALMELPIEAVQQQVEKVHALMKSVMKKGMHYGTIPNTGDKLTLFKSGAEKLGFVFRLVPHFEVTEKELADGHREARVLCTLRHQVTEAYVGQGVGSCSSMEKKYRYRRDGTENPNIADTYNTILKMAKKRAVVDATISSCAASDIFAQDKEDLPADQEKAGAQGKEQANVPMSADQMQGVLLAHREVQGYMELHGEALTPEQRYYMATLGFRAVEQWYVAHKEPGPLVKEMLEKIRAKVTEKETEGGPGAGNDEQPGGEGNDQADSKQERGGGAEGMKAEFDAAAAEQQATDRKEDMAKLAKEIGDDWVPRLPCRKCKAPMEYVWKRCPKCNSTFGGLTIEEAYRRAEQEQAPPTDSSEAAAQAGGEPAVEQEFKEKISKEAHGLQNDLPVF